MSSINLNITELDRDKLIALDKHINHFNDPEGSLINILHYAQHLFGYIPTNLQLHIARSIGCGAAKINGVVSFYSYFTQERTGKNLISVCMGTACYVKGSEKVLHKFLKELDVDKNEMTKDEQFTVKDVRCIGACGLAPIITVGDKVYAHVKEEDVFDIIKEYRGDDA